jgi:hypothetical protein
MSKRFLLAFALLPLAALTACDDTNTGPPQEATEKEFAAPSFDMGGNENAVQFTEFPFGGIGVIRDASLCAGLFGDGKTAEDFLREHKTEDGMLHATDKQALLLYDGPLGNFVGTGKWSFRSGWLPGFTAPTVFQVSGNVTNDLDVSDTRKLVCVLDSNEGTFFIRLGKDQVGNSD